MQRSAKIPTMGCTWRTAHCRDFLLAAADVCLIVGNFLSEGVRCGLDKEIAPDGTYLAYFPFGAMIERSQMTSYHKKLQSFVVRSRKMWCITKETTQG